MQGGEVTDRFNYLTVVLDHDIREDDAQSIISAVAMIKGVIAVKGNVSDPSEWSARERVRSELITNLYDVLKDKP